MNDQSDLLRDPDDLAEVLEAYGQAIPDDPAAQRQRALELFKEVPTTEVLALFAQHATGFMRMVQDIDKFCQSLGITVGGRIQVQIEGLPLQFSGLSSGWVFDGPSDWESAEQRALALAEELRYLTEEFDPKRATCSRERLTQFGRSLQGTRYEHVGWSEPLRVDNELSNGNSWRESHEKDQTTLRPRIQDISSSRA